MGERKKDEADEAWRMKLHEAEVRGAAGRELAVKDQADSERMMAELRQAHADELSSKVVEFKEALAQRDIEINQAKQHFKKVERSSLEADEIWKQRLSKA